MSHSRQGHSLPTTIAKRVGPDFASLAPACLTAILAATCLAYWPALQGTPLWDDDAHLTKLELQSWSGLKQIWCDPSATQQYYPLLHTAFWLEHQLWGDWVVGYHGITLFWHLLAVVLLYSILRKLEVPGALLAAAIFALHPVMVESVAWISEQKNTLSAVFYLSALRVYLAFDQARKRSFYAASLALFVLGLLTKTVTATLPAAVLVVFWWQRGRIEWRQDVVPLLPFFTLGAAAGIVTAWVEYSLIGAQGEQFHMTLFERLLLAGRVPWFYLSKLVWPANLMFIYPRWEIDAGRWWQWLFLAATLAVLAALWRLRHWSRGPLAAWLLFVGTLAPVLGFLNVYPFIFSFVADHFQYLASIGMIVLAAASITRMLQSLPTLIQYFGVAACLILLGTLAALTFKQSGMYADSIRLYEATLARNPNCWMAHYNLANTLLSVGQHDKAIHHFREDMRLRPHQLEPRVNLSVALKDAGQVQEAIEVCREAIRIFPEAYEPLCNLGGALVVMGKYAEALDAYDAALALRPRDPSTLNLIAVALMQQQRHTDALEYVQRALEIDPKSVDSHDTMGLLMIHFGKTPQAIEHFLTALKFNPDDYSAHNNLGLLYASQGDVAKSIHHFEEAVRVSPKSAQAHNNLGELLRQTGRVEESISHYQEAIRLQPTFSQPYLNLARAFAVLNRSGEAQATAEKGLETARRLNQEGVAATIETWLEHYQAELHRDVHAEDKPDVAPQ